MPVNTVKSDAPKNDNEPVKEEAPAKVAPKTEDVTTGRQAPSTEPVTQDKPEPEEEEDTRPQSYVWLTDGSVLRVYNEDLPGASGSQNAFGHWQRGNKVYEIVGVYPVENTVKEN